MTTCHARAGVASRQLDEPSTRDSQRSKRTQIVSRVPRVVLVASIFLGGMLASCCCCRAPRGKSSLEAGARPRTSLEGSMT